MSIFDDAKAARSGKVGRILGSANASNAAAVMAKEGARGTTPVKHAVDNVKVGGKTPKARADRPARARGGAVSRKGKTNVTVIVAPQGSAQPPQVAVGANAPPMPMPPAGGAPMAPPGPGAVPAQARAPMAPPVSPGGPAMPMRKRGGAVMKAGAGSGVGRLEKL